jgi:hypothetical protein
VPDFDYLSINAIHSLLYVRKGCAYNSTFFCNSVMPDIVQGICTYSWRKILKGIMAQLANALPHNSRKSTECLEQFRACRVPHPAYSRGLPPSDFFLFHSVKSEMPSLAIWSKEDLICKIRRIFKEILKVTLISAILHGQNGLSR